MKIKTWKLWLLAAFCAVFVSIMNLIDKKYFSCILYIVLGCLNITLSITNYKNRNKANKIEKSDNVMTDVDNYLRDFIDKGKKDEAVRYCSRTIRIDLKKAQKYINILEKESK